MTVFTSIAGIGLFHRSCLGCHPPRALRFLTSRAVLDELLGHNAYEVLGIPESSTSSEIKSSFRKLAKENHPDVASSDGASASRRFLLILAAYEILSDHGKRAHYDSYLRSQREAIWKPHQQDYAMYTYNSSVKLSEHIEVVEWLKCYKLVIDDILFRKRSVNGSRYWDNIENELYEAIRAAYYGPLIVSLKLLPACFEAEVRSSGETAEVLHLVSGRDLFGIVHVVNDIPRLWHSHYKKLINHQMDNLNIDAAARTTTTIINVPPSEDVQNCNKPSTHPNMNTSDAYKDLELHISGRVVATAMRIPPNASFNGVREVDSQDLIQVFFKVHEVYEHPTKESDRVLSDAHGSMILLGTVKGLGTTPEEGYCFLYDASGAKTHMIMKHRTLLVKHMHWFSLGDDISSCECRCSRARLPSSKFWLFEPRCGMHDIGGWYIETFGHDKRRKTILSQRQWHGYDKHEKRVHPAIYLLTLAYRTLDIEVAKRKRSIVKDIFMPRLSNAIQWCKKLI